MKGQQCPRKDTVETGAGTVGYRPRPVVLAIDDEPGVRESLQLILQEEFEVLEAADGASALALLGERQVDVALLDVRMPGEPGSAVLPKILAIDDTKTLLSLLSMTLRNAGHEVAEAENGEEGLTRFDQFKPDLVITDLNMPIMDGIEFTRACRSRPAGQNTPIIVLTTENGAEIKAEGRRAGASAWMVKPFEPNTLLGLVARYQN